MLFFWITVKEINLNICHLIDYAKIQIPSGIQLELSKEGKNAGNKNLTSNTILSSKVVFKIFKSGSDGVTGFYFP